MSTFVSDDGMDDLAALMDDGTGTEWSSAEGLTRATSGDSLPSAVAGKARGRGNRGSKSKAIGKYTNCNVCGSDDMAAGMRQCKVHAAPRCKCNGYTGQAWDASPDTASTRG